MRVHSDKQPCPCGCEYYAQAHAELLGSTMTAMVTFKKRQYTMDERKNEEEKREFERKGSTEDTELTIERVTDDE